MPDRSEAVERAARELVVNIEGVQDWGGTLVGYKLEALESALALPAGPDPAAENERLRTALQGFETFHSGHVNCPEINRLMKVARAALEGTCEKNM